MSIGMREDPRLRPLLIRWEEACERGETPSAEELCRDCPELLDELSQRIRLLRDWDQLLPGSDSRSGQSTGSPTPRGEVPTSARITARFLGLNYHDRGGLGTIFKARHPDLGRDVALKFIRDGRSRDRDCVGRFLREARITARLEHPGIVPIYGLGWDDEGNPCYAMRFIEGRTLEQEIRTFYGTRAKTRDREPLERDKAFRALIQRFRAACTTVAYAHSRGVIHRDLKPSNIMLGPFDETLVMDWGLGKVLADAEPPEAEADRTGLPQSDRGPEEIETHGILGTPGFMSPEQQEGPSEEIGPASDVYSLGATLYVVLTGRRPFPDRTIGEVAAKVSKGEFPPPRVANPDLPRALESICLRAMSPAPGDRYPSALALAGDLENWLSGERVMAWSEPWTIQARRWMDRHRTFVTSTAVATLLALLSLGVILLLQERARHTLERQYEQLQEANERSDASRNRAERRLELALGAIDTFRSTVDESPEIRYRAELKPLRQNLLRLPHEFYQRIRRDIEQGDDAGGDPVSGLARVILNLASTTAEVDSRPAAILAFQQGISILDGAIRERPAEDRLLLLQARSRRQLSVLLRGEERLAEASESLVRATKLFRELVALQPDCPEFGGELAVSLDELALVHAKAGRLKDAIACDEEARDILLRVTAGRPGETTDLDRLAMVLTRLGMARKRAGQPLEALADYEQALKLREKPLLLTTKDPRIRGNRATVLHNIGNVRRQLGDSTGAIEAYRRAVEVFEPLVRDYHSISDFRVDMAAALGNLTLMTGKANRGTTRIAAFTRIAELQREVVREHPKVVKFTIDLVLTLRNLATCKNEKALRSEALADLNEGIAMLERLFAQDLDPLGELRPLHGQISTARARILDDQGRQLEAVASYRTAIRQLREAVLKWRGSMELHDQTIGTMASFTSLLLVMGRADEAASNLEALRSLFPREHGLVDFECAEALAKVYPRIVDPRGRDARTVAVAAENYARFVLSVVEHAFDSGYQDFSFLTRQPSFGPILQRPDFQAFLARTLDRAFPARPFASP